MTELDLRAEPYDGPAAVQLTAEVQDEYVVRYGAPDETPVDPAQFAPPDGRFLIGYLGTEPVAMGGLRRLDADTIEIKRMYVRPDYRGRGLSRVMLTALEQQAQAMGASRVVLETGTRQPEAMRLYETSGYERIEPFGHYRCSPDSRSYAKAITSTINAS